MDSEALVERFVDVFLANPGTKPGDLVASLERGNIPKAEAECLLAFVPMAFAHVLLAPMGVTLPTRFKAWDPDTNDSEFGMLEDEFIFVTARSFASKRLERPGEGTRVRAVACCSAEWQVIQKLTTDGSTADGCVLTEPVLARVPLQYFRRSPERSPRRSWWGWLTGR